MSSSYNAMAFYEIGAAEVIDEKELSGEILKQKVYDLLENNQKE
jgi:UDP-N-acetylglucosamine:LPS N-acetylglucosamine transferase